MTASSVVQRLLCRAPPNRNDISEKAYMRALTYIMRRQGLQCHGRMFEDLFATQVRLAADASLWRQTHFGLVLVSGVRVWSSDQIAYCLGSRLRQIDFTQKLESSELAIGLPLLSGSEQLRDKANHLMNALSGPRGNGLTSGPLALATAIHPLDGYSACDLLESARARLSSTEGSIVEWPGSADKMRGTSPQRPRTEPVLNIVPQSA